MQDAPNHRGNFDQVVSILDVPLQLYGTHQLLIKPDPTVTIIDIITTKLIFKKEMLLYSSREGWKNILRVDTRYNKNK